MSKVYLAAALRRARREQMTASGRVVLLGPGRGTKHRIGADRFWTKGAPAQRSDAFSVIEYEGAAGVPGPPPHVHHRFEEAWYLLEGKVRFSAGGSLKTAGPGAYLLVPRGVVHSFQVVSRTAARWIGIFSPGRYVGLVEELGALLPSYGPPDARKMARLFSKYDSALVG